MKKLAIVALFLGMGFLLSGTVNACWQEGGYGWGPRGGYGMNYGTTNVDRLRSFQKETLGLRDELAAKRFELQNEYNKPTYDSKRIATLRREVVDLESKIQEVSYKNGVPSWGATGGMMGPMYGYGMCPMGW